MKNDDKFVEIEIVEEEQKELINDLIAVGQYKNVAPIKFVFAMIKLIDTICDCEGYDADHLLQLYFDNETDDKLH